ncbi:MAG: hypothetical protein QY318_03890 [Candidatus Dojkabacteria bacterium]|nr:MAG: hypothetical protein QY318_03890 [Candidatus Dojkabacteria bacterium]
MDSLVLDKVVSSVLSSKKYRYLYEPTIRRTVEELATRYPEKKLDNETRKRLHQLWGAYIKRPNFMKVLEQVEADITSGAEAKDVLLPLLRLQTSTEERIPVVNEIYLKIAESIDAKIESIVEYGAGMNALTYPWMQEAFGQSVKYTGVDVDSELADFQNRIFMKLGLEERAKAIQGDILCDELLEADVVFLFKLLPLLEHQVKGSGGEILKQLKAKYIVVTFPTKSIGGKEKGMVDNYRTLISAVTSGEEWAVEEVLMESEVLFVISK